MITIKEPLSHFHLAVTRLGLCIAAIEVGNFDAANAAAWLSADGVSRSEGATPAELYQLLRTQYLSPDPRLPTGVYL